MRNSKREKTVQTFTHFLSGAISVPYLRLYVSLHISVFLYAATEYASDRFRRTEQKKHSAWEHTLRYTKKTTGNE